MVAWWPRRSFTYFERLHDRPENFAYSTVCLRAPRGVLPVRLGDGGDDARPAALGQVSPGNVFRGRFLPLIARGSLCALFILPYIP